MYSYRSVYQKEKKDGNNKKKKRRMRSIPSRRQNLTICTNDHILVSSSACSIIWVVFGRMQHCAEMGVAVETVDFPPDF
jgi:hypothetical protein